MNDMTQTPHLSSESGDVWQQLMDTYQMDEQTQQLIFVKYIGRSDAHLTMYQKAEHGWEEILSCEAFVGKNGIGKAREGDTKTPVGAFDLPQAFGILPDPGALTPYFQITESMYWCGDEHFYNQLIDIHEHPHDCQGEHLIEIAPHYNYGMVIGYNKECIFGEGSAIFLHCTGSEPYTGGCVAVSEPDMITILRHAAPGTKICIWPES
jgi:L,D-peptidoglycan transpeptidase YkuD (ErfK/YbiS/YcfS/YnhG family)